MARNSRICGLGMAWAIEYDPHASICCIISQSCNKRQTKYLLISFVFCAICIIFANCYEKKKILNDDAGPDAHDDELPRAGECEV